MKTEPTDLDREAARLFMPAPGVRAFGHVQSHQCQAIAWYRVCEFDGVRTRVAMLESAEIQGAGFGWKMREPEALDTDDDATVGVMVAQVEAALEAIDRPRGYLHPWDGGWAMRHGEAIRRYAGPTKGAALVAAVRALKGIATP